MKVIELKEMMLGMLVTKEFKIKSLDNAIRLKLGNIEFSLFSDKSPRLSISFISQAKGNKSEYSAADVMRMDVNSQIYCGIYNAMIDSAINSKLSKNIKLGFPNEDGSYNKGPENIKELVDHMIESMKNAKSFEYYRGYLRFNEFRVKLHESDLDEFSIEYIEAHTHYNNGPAGQHILVTPEHVQSLILKRLILNAVNDERLVNADLLKVIENGKLNNEEN